MRHDAVLIRVSTDEQDHKGQIENVRRMLESRGITVPEKYWFVYTVSRSKVSSDKVFQHFMAQLEAGEIGTAYVESRNRFGQTDPGEYFAIMGKFVEHGAALMALADNCDLTKGGMASDVTAVVGVHTNKEKLRQTGYQTIRTRINRFLATGSWPTGPHPFGYGKACYSPDGTTLKWVWQPISRTKGLTYDTTATGKLRRKPREQAPAKLPRKDRADIIKLTPSNNPKYLLAIRRIFELYTEVSLSRRAISKRLNEEGLQYYDRPFTHSLVTQILANPAYMGDTHFGKSQHADYYTFDANGEVKNVEGHKPENRERAVAERVVKKKTHEGIVSCKTWKRAAAKLAAEQEVTNYAPRNPLYYLKSLLVCGHCGKPMVGRMDGGRPTYICGSYSAACSSGQETDCGFYRVRHDHIEQILLDKIKERNLEFEKTVSIAAHDNLSERLARLQNGEDTFSKEWKVCVSEGIDALAKYMVEEYGVEYPAIQRVRRLALDYFFEDQLSDNRFAGLPFDLEGLRKALFEIETDAAAEATEQVAQLGADIERFTVAWVEAAGMQRDVLKRKATEAETELEQWRQRTTPLSQRMAELLAAHDNRNTERAQMLEELPKLELRERGEAFRRLLKRVELYWDKEWRPTRKDTKRKTNRKGRYKYTLRKDLMTWAFNTSDVASNW